MNRAAGLAEKIKEKRNLLRQKHLAGAGGFEISGEWTAFVDGIILELLEHEAGEISPDSFVLAALGGYGRGELNPNSDIDLLFLFEKTVPLKKEAAPTGIIPLMWDIGFKVGHSTRTVADCIRISLEDSVSKTSMIESRFLYGNRDLFGFFERKFKKKAIDVSVVGFVKGKRHETELRHKNFQFTPFLTEPNIKESPGGLRDYQTALWIAAARYGVKDIEGLEKRGLVERREKEILRNALDFLFRIRNDLHFHDDRPNDVLAFAVQPDVAERLGYGGGVKERVVAMMNDYYRAADILFRFGASVADQGYRYRPGRAGDFLVKLRHRQLAPDIFAGPEEIYTKNITAEDMALSPATVYAILKFACEKQLQLSPLLRKAFEKVGALWKRKRPDMPALADGFRSLLRMDKSADQLRNMRDAKMLTAVIPEFHAIRFLTPFDLYHRFTVDEHSFLALDIFDGLKENDNPDLDLLRTLYENEKRKDLLRLAILLHDVGKGDAWEGREEDINPQTIKNLGYSMEEVDAVRTVVQLHLLMNRVAQRRDINDRRTLKNFCEQVGNARTLKRLYMLTYADTAAVGPDVWNSWKAVLLNGLFNAAMEFFGEGAVQARPAVILSREGGNFVKSMPHNYFAIRSAGQIEEDARLFKEFMESGKEPLIAHRNFGEKEPGELTVISENELGLLARLLGTLMSKNMSIHYAQILTRNDGVVVDFFRVTGKDGKPVLDEGIWARLEGDIKKVLNGEKTVEELLCNRRKMSGEEKNLPGSEPTIKILNDESFDCTVIEIIAQDRLGLVYDLAGAFSEMQTNIASAHITTEGHMAINSIYINETNGRKIENRIRLAEIRQKLISAIAQKE